MTTRDYSAYLRRLNDHCARTLAEAVSLCESRAHRHIEVEHWMIKLLETCGGDLPAIADRYALDIDAIWNGLVVAIDRLPSDLRGKPVLSERLGQWLELAWLKASVDGQSAIRSAHLLAALAERPSLLRAADAWQLLTIPPASIVWMIAELDRTSIEAPAGHSNANAATNESTSDTADATSGKPVRTDSGMPDNPTASARPRNTALAAALPSNPATDALARFTLDLTEKARAGRIDPVFGRDAEIRQMVDILARRRKNNPILVGDPGVGKTALVEGLAQRIVEGNVPASLRDVRLLTLDLGLLQAGAGVKGEFEQRLKHVIDAVQQSTTPVLLFIDEAHTLVGSGNAPGGADASNLLKPALARGELRTIAATTWSEYKQYFERDAALERRFQMVKVDEPGDHHACLMLRGLKERYARHHCVTITDAAIVAAVRLSRRYLSGRQLPDKAVDLLDTAAARARISRETTPDAIAALHAERAALDIERKALVDDQVSAEGGSHERIGEIEIRVVALTNELERLEAESAAQHAIVRKLVQLRLDWDAALDESARRDLEHTIRVARDKLAECGAQTLVEAEVDASSIARVIADWTGIPAGRLMEDELMALLDLEARLAQFVVGQDEALAALGKRLRAAKAGLTSEEAPLGVFLLVGPSGVGKTETARALAQLMFGGERALITLNLSEYNEAHMVSQLKGAPPGYVGYGRGGVLTEAVRQRPYSVVLLDEVEKAHPDVLTLFYQVFDRGYMRDGEGRLIDFSNTVILMTSNLGSETIMALTRPSNSATEATTEATTAPGTGTRTEAPDATASTGELLEAIRPKLLDHFHAALLSRFQTIVYRPLSDTALSQIVRMKLEKVQARLQRRFGASLEADDALIVELVRACLLPDSGARNIDSLLDQQILPVLSRELLLRAAQHVDTGTVRLTFTQAEGIGVQFERSRAELEPVA